MSEAKTKAPLIIVRGPDDCHEVRSSSITWVCGRPSDDSCLNSLSPISGSSFDVPDGGPCEKSTAPNHSSSASLNNENCFQTSQCRNDSRKTSVVYNDSSEANGSSTMSTAKYVSSITSERILDGHMSDDTFPYTSEVPQRSIITAPGRARRSYMDNLIYGESFLPPAHRGIYFQSNANVSAHILTPPERRMLATFRQRSAPSLPRKTNQSEFTNALFSMMVTYTKKKILGFIRAHVCNQNLPRIFLSSFSQKFA